MGINNIAHEVLVQMLLLKLTSMKIGRFWKNPRGVAMTRRGQVMSFGVDGQADISGILIGGWRAEVEAKTGSGVLNKEQIAFKEMILHWGGFYFEARDIESTEAAATAFLKSKESGKSFFTK